MIANYVVGAGFRKCYVLLQIDPGIGAGERLVKEPRFIDRVGGKRNRAHTGRDIKRELGLRQPWTDHCRGGAVIPQSLDNRYAQTYVERETCLGFKLEPYTRGI